MAVGAGERLAGAAARWSARPARRARLYEDAQGRIAFRDAALSPTPARTWRGRNAAVTGAIISHFERGDPGVQRVVNQAEIGYQSARGSIPELVATDTRTYDSSDPQDTHRFPANYLIGLGATADDLIVMLAQSNDPSALVGSINQDAHIVSFGAYRLAIKRGPPVSGEIGPGVDLSRISGAEIAFLTAWVIRNAGTPTSQNAAYLQQQVGADLQMTTPAPNSFAPQSLVLTSAYQSSDGQFPTSPPAGWTPGHATNASQLQTGDAFQPGDWTFPGPAARFGRVVTLAVPPIISDVWTGMESFSLADGQTAVLDVLLRDPTLSIIPPEASTDFSGAATVAAVLRSPTDARVTITATAAGQVTLTGLRGIALALAPQEEATASDASSRTSYGPRPYREQTHPYLSQSEAQALANEIVAYSAHPRPSWRVDLDADRSALELAACLEAEVGERIRTFIDADFDEDGELLGIDHRIDGPATLLQTRFTLLAAETVLPAAHRLYLGSTANPMFLGSAANPLELR